MLQPRQGGIRNRLLKKLVLSDYERISEHLSQVHLKRGTVVAEEGKPIDFVYFLEDGVGSVLAKTPEGNRCEAGIFGFEGYIPTSAVAGVAHASFDVVIQLEAYGQQMSYDNFRTLMETDRNFAKIMFRSIEGFAVQVAYTAVSNAVHDVTERLARWLLMCDDRMTGDELALTHDFLSTMLSVRRPSVTTSLHVLEGLRLIKAERANITIRDRVRLEEFAHDAYGKAERRFDSLMDEIE